ncbi:MAG: type I-E CRISPR-associated protein Cas6/Cse3/CasE [Candidatus Methylomirabilis sp.]|nr:type I-E CRISPR-associated protein Cas6/Cse3/CasE [Deltaproteobacteria bacterium]
MYVSTLLIDVGANPDRPRPGRLWLRNLYRVHQRLCMAFPSAERKAADPEMVAPYSPEHFGGGQVHVKRAEGAGFLFRVDPIPGGGCAILVLSAVELDWDYAFHNAGHILAAPPEKPRPLEFPIDAGERFRFRLQANPVRRASERSTDGQGRPLGDRWKGKRVPIPGDADSLFKWLERRAGSAGFKVERTDVASIQPGWVYVNKGGDDGKAVRLRSVRYEGVLEVTEPEAFRRALASGIGPAKGFGFGLLSLAPAQG